MSKEWMLQTLTTLGFTKTDALVYLYLAFEGPQQAKNIAQTLKINKPKLYRSLRKLEQKRIAIASQKRPVHFSVVPFEKILEGLIKAQLNEAKRIERKKEEILNQWHANMNMQFKKTALMCTRNGGFIV